MTDTATHRPYSTSTAAVRLRQLLDADGGFTVRRRSGRPVSAGISVATHPSRSLTFSRPIVWVTALAVIAARGRAASRRGPSLDDVG
jgi:hypothetical protein